MIFNRERETNKFLFKRIPLILVMIFTFASLSGCGSKKDEEKKNTVFVFAGNPISKGEVYIYAQTIIEDYEATYGKDVWNMQVTVSDGTEMNMEEATRRDIIDAIVRVKVLSSMAKNKGIELDDNEKAAEINKADIFFNRLTDEQIDRMELTESLVQNVFCENLLANKVYTAIVKEAGIEMSDEDARVTTFYDMFFSYYTENINGEIFEINDEKKSEQLEKADQAYATLTNPTSEDGVDIEGLSTFYKLKNSGYYTLTPKEIKAEYGEKIYDILYELEDGSYSVVVETEYGYHIFYMKYKTDQEATAERKAKLVAEAEERYFASKLPQWIADLDKGYSYTGSVNFDVYKQISFR